MRDATISRCQVTGNSRILIIGLALVVGAGWLSGPANVSAGNKADTTAVKLTEAAIEAGLAGDLAERRDLLKQAIQASPDYAPARWESGQILVEDQWLLVGEAQVAAKANRRLQEYRQLREVAPDTPAAHLELARQCRRQRLDDEARYHWLKVVEADPRNTEALTALNMTWHEGELVSEATAERLSDEQRSQLRAQKHWKHRIAAWERGLVAGGNEARAAIDQLQAEVDETAILTFEKLAAGIEEANANEGERHRRLCTEFLTALCKMPSFAATESLTRFAVLAPDESLRYYAVTYLAERPRHETVPLLLRGLQAPIQSQFEIYVSPYGNVTYTHEVRTSDSDKNYVIQQTRLGRAEVVSTRPRQPAVVQILREKERAKGATPRYAMEAVAEAHRVQRRIDAKNVQAAKLNERLTGVLAQLTGESHGADPVGWWDYWNDYNEYEDHGYRPTFEDHRYAYDTAYIPVNPMTPYLFRRSSSCFVAGTPVWIKTGMVPIESLEPGDLVLSHDVRTGELAYRPVLVTTTREPSPILEIVINDRQLRTTLGHPFWVAGQGWRMAKELAAGDLLLTVDGPAKVAAISPSREAEAFNLVVEGASNYFVGDVGLLVHDNTPRRPELVRLGMR